MSKSQYPVLIATRYSANLAAELSAVSKALNKPVATIIREIVNDNLPRYVAAQKKKQQPRFHLDKENEQ